MLNAGAALCTAVAINAPVLMLTGQMPSSFLGRGRGHLHELPDRMATLNSFIKWAGRAPRAAEAPALIGEAFRRMLGGRPGPVSVEMCWDTMARRTPVEPVPLPAPPEPNPEAVAEAATLIAEARRPMITVGSGAQLASAEVQALAEALGAPVAAFRNGRGVVSADHALGVNMAEAWELWPETDLVIGIGSRCELQSMRWTGMMDCADRLAPPRKLIRIEIEPEELLRLKPDVGIVADAAAGARALAEAVAKTVTPDAGAPDRVGAAKAAARARIEEVQPRVAYLDAIRAMLPRDGILVKDICQAGFASYFAWPVYQPRTYLTSGYQGNLGFVFPTALVAKVGCPDKAVVMITGDGGFMYAAPELSTAAQHGIGVVTVLFRNQAYVNIRHDQLTLFDCRMITCDLPEIDYVKLAEAQGVAGYRASSPETFKPVLEKAIADDAPALIEVAVDPDTEVTPWPHIIHGL